MVQVTPPISIERSTLLAAWMRYGCVLYTVATEFYTD